MVIDHATFGAIILLVWLAGFLFELGIRWR